MLPPATRSRYHEAANEALRLVRSRSQLLWAACSSEYRHPGGHARVTATRLERQGPVLVLQDSPLV